MKCFISALALAIPSLCNAAYYLEDEVPAKITAQLAVVEDKYQAQPTYSYNVPFYAQKYILGPTAVTSLKALLPDLTRAKAITVEGRPDANGQNDTDLARRRGLAIKKFLVINGIPESRINVEIQREIKFDVNPSIFNSTLYTSESLPNLPNKVKSTLYTELPTISQAVPVQQDVIQKNKQAEAKVAPAAAPKPVAQAPQNSEKATKVEGSFNVLRKDMVDKPQPPPPTAYDFPVTADFDSESRSAIARFATSTKVSAVVADGSIAGYKKAKEISSYINEVTGMRPEVKAKGAPKGLVTVKG